MNHTAQEIFKSALHGDMETVKRAVQAGFDINSIAKNGMSLLLVTIWENGNLPLVRYLFERGADPHYRQPSNSWNALCYAAINNHSAVLEFLFAQGLKLDEAAGDWKALMFAVQYRSFDTVPILLKNGANVNVQDEKGQTALIRAAKASNTQMLNILLEFFPDLNIQDQEGRTALMHACLKAKSENVQSLLDAGSDSSIVDNSGQTALNLAQAKKRTKHIELLQAD